MNTSEASQTGDHGDGLTRKQSLILSRRSVTERWNVPEAVRRSMIAQLLMIANDPKAKRRDRTTAMKTILAMDRLNVDWAKFEAEQNVEIETGDYAVDLSSNPEEDDPGQ